MTLRFKLLRERIALLFDSAQLIAFCAQGISNGKLSGSISLARLCLKLRLQCFELLFKLRLFVLSCKLKIFGFGTELLGLCGKLAIALRNLRTQLFFGFRNRKSHILFAILFGKRNTLVQLALEFMIAHLVQKSSVAAFVNGEDLATMRAFDLVHSVPFRVIMRVATLFELSCGA